MQRLDKVHLSFGMELVANITCLAYAGLQYRTSDIKEKLY